MDKFEGDRDTKEERSDSNGRNLIVSSHLTTKVIPSHNNDKPNTQYVTMSGDGYGGGETDVGRAVVASNSNTPTTMKSLPSNSSLASSHESSTIKDDKRGGEERRRQSSDIGDTCAESRQDISSNPEGMKVLYPDSEKLIYSQTMIGHHGPMKFDERNSSNDISSVIENNSNHSNTDILFNKEVHNMQNSNTCTDESPSTNGELLSMQRESSGVGSSLLHQSMLREKRDGEIKLFVGQIPRNLYEKDLESTFSVFGEIKEFVVLRDKVNSAHRGCAFLTYKSKESAELCIKELHNKRKLGSSSNALQVKKADVSVDKESKLFIGMLPKDVDEERVRGLFERFGTINEIHIIRDVETGAGKGCAFLKFNDTDSARRAVAEMNESQILEKCSRPMVVKVADSKKGNQGTGNISHLNNHVDIGMMGGAQRMNTNNSMTLQHINMMMQVNTQINDNMNRLGVNNKIMNTKSLMTFHKPDGGMYSRFQPLQESGAQLSAVNNDARQNITTNNTLSNQSIIWHSNQQEHNSLNAEARLSGTTNSNGNSVYANSQNVLQNISPVTQTLSNSNRSSIAGRSDSMTFDHSNAVRTTISSSPEDSISNQLNTSDSNLVGMLGSIGNHSSQSNINSVSAPIATGILGSNSGSLSSSNNNIEELLNPGSASDPERLKSYSSNSLRGLINHSQSQTFGQTMTHPQQQTHQSKYKNRPMEGPVGANLFIYHLPHSLTDADLATLFNNFGNVISAKVYVDKHTNESKGFGFVSYDDPASAREAIKHMHQFQIESKRLKVELKNESGAMNNIQHLQLLNDFNLNNNSSMRNVVLDGQLRTTNSNVNDPRQSSTAFLNNRNEILNNRGEWNNRTMNNNGNSYTNIQGAMRINDITSDRHMSAYNQRRSSGSKNENNFGPQMNLNNGHIPLNMQSRHISQSNRSPKNGQTLGIYQHQSNLGSGHHNRTHFQPSNNPIDYAANGSHMGLDLLDSGNPLNPHGGNQYFDINQNLSYTPNVHPDHGSNYRNEPGYHSQYHLNFNHRYDYNGQFNQFRDKNVESDSNYLKNQVFETKVNTFFNNQIRQDNIMDVNNNNALNGLSTTNLSVNQEETQGIERERNLSTTSTLPSHSSHDNLTEANMGLPSTVSSLTNQSESTSKPTSDSSQSLSDAVHKLQL